MSDPFLLSEHVQRATPTFSTRRYKLMVSCWHQEPGMRPSFRELTSHWEKILQDSVEYLDLNPRTVHNQAYFASLHDLDSPSSAYLYISLLFLDSC